VSRLVSEIDCTKPRSNISSSTNPGCSKSPHSFSFYTSSLVRKLLLLLLYNVIAFGDLSAGEDHTLNATVLGESTSNSVCVICMLCIGEGENAL